MSKYIGLVRELNPGPLAPEARIIPLDQRAMSLRWQMNNRGEKTLCYLLTAAL